MPVSRISPELIDRSFGLLAIVENTRVLLPLKAVECEFSVAAGLVAVRMTQVFRQENPKPLDCDYLFPLPADASVYDCEADVNGRIIRAKVRERGEAVRLAEEKKAEGRRVALVEAERENLFTLSLKNLQPDDLVLVTLKYIQPLRQLADLPSVEIPFCSGTRYIPGNPLIRSNRGHGIVDDTDQVPDASRLSPVRMDREHPDAAFIDIRGRLDAQFVEAASLLSPSHNIISRPEGGQVTVRLSDKGEVPDRDFVLRWQETGVEHLAARAWIQELGAQSYALMEIRAPQATGAPVPMDFYFLVDISGSMGGIKWQKAALAVQTCVAKLAEQDRVMLTLFNNGVRDFAEQPLPPAQLLADAQFQQLQQLQANGGTELGQALRHVLELAATHSPASLDGARRSVPGETAAAHLPERQPTLILITDAQVGNDAVILKIAEAAGDLPMHCFGLDTALNDALLLALARQQRGTFHSLNPSDDVAKIVSELAQTIRHPVLRDLSLSAGWEPDVKYLPPLYSGQVYHLAARCTGRQPLELAARNGVAEPGPIPVSSVPATGEAPYLHWCKHRIQRLMQERNHAEAIALSVQSNLICPLTAFIAWDESEKVAVASHALAQPNVMALYEATLGTAAGAGGTLRDDSKRGRLLMIKRSRVHRLAEFMGAGGVRNQDVAKPDRTMADHTQMLCPPYNTPQQIVREIAEYSSKYFKVFQAPPQNDKLQRIGTFKQLFREISTHGGLRELEPGFLKIMEWAFADENRWRPRSELVARLLWDLWQLAEKREQAFEALCRQLVPLERKHSRPAETLFRLRSAIVARSWTEVELVQMLEAEFQERVDAQVVADYVRIPGEMSQAIEAFAEQHLKS